MIQLKKAVSSSVGQKFLMALTGLGLIGFTVAHLAGNLALYKSSGDSFNAYALMLENLGWIKIAAEIGLIILFGAHIVMGIALKANHKKARGAGYRIWKSKSNAASGLPKAEMNPSNLSSRNMIITGIALLAFLIFHVYQFKYGPSIDEGYKLQQN